MCSVPVVGPWEASGLFHSPQPEGSCVWEAKEQWLSALVSTTATQIREQQDGRAACPRLPSHSVKGSVSQVRLGRLGRAPVLDLTALLILRTPVQPSPPPSHELGQVGNFDVEITDVDVPRDLRKVDVLHSRHGPRGGC